MNNHFNKFLRNTENAELSAVTPNFENGVVNLRFNFYSLTLEKL